MKPRAYADPEYGRGVHVVDSGEMDALFVDAAEVREQIRSIIGAPDYRPPLLPAAAMEVHRLSQKRDVEIRHVVETVEKDPVLAGSLLRMARSPMYAGAVPPDSLEEAVARLGLHRIRDLAFEVAMASKVFRAPGYGELMDSLRDHSVATAHAARAVGRATGRSDEAFLCGLLHDVGAVAIVLALVETGRKVAPEVLAMLISDLHEEAGEVLLHAWDLPEALVPAVTKHHVPKSPGGAVVRLAEQITDELGFGVKIGPMEVEPPQDRELLRSLDILHIDAATLEDLRREVEPVLENIRGPASKTPAAAPKATPAKKRPSAAAPAPPSGSRFGMGAVIGGLLVGGALLAGVAALLS
ncbi:MAG: HDOD domain-containing protein [Myxococcales bacterium]|nr:HDOD domain-containing protein [Myxococcales bacterium]